jgi:hypothetical protein
VAVQGVGNMIRHFILLKNIAMKKQLGILSFNLVVSLRSDQWQVLVNVVMILQVTLKGGDFLD